MTESSGFGPHSKSHLAKSTLKGLTDLVNNIFEDISQRNQCKVFLKRVLTTYESGDLDATDKHLAKEPKELERVYPEAKQIIHNLRLDVDRQLAERFDQLGQYLANYSTEKGIRLKGISPNFIVDGLIEVTLDKENRAAKVGASYIRTLDWKKIRDLLDSEWERIWGRTFDAALYRDELLAAYKEIMELKPNPSGWVSLNDIYQKLKENLEQKNPNWREHGRVASYYKDEFSADVSKLWRSQVEGDLSPPHLELSAIRDPRRAYDVILIDGTTAHYGFLRPLR